MPAQDLNFGVAGQFFGSAVEKYEASFYVRDKDSVFHAFKEIGVAFFERNIDVRELLITFEE